MADDTCPPLRSVSGYDESQCRCTGNSVINHYFACFSTTGHSSDPQLRLGRLQLQGALLSAIGFRRPAGGVLVHYGPVQRLDDASSDHRRRRLPPARHTLAVVTRSSSTPSSSSPSPSPSPHRPELRMANRTNTCIPIINVYLLIICRLNIKAKETYFSFLLDATKTRLCVQWVVLYNGTDIDITSTSPPARRVSVCVCVRVPHTTRTTQMCRDGWKSDAVLSMFRSFSYIRTMVNLKRLHK